MRIRKKIAKHDDGSASVIALLVVVTMMGVSGAVLAVAMRGQSERSGAVADEQAMYAARAGVAHAVANLTAGNPGAIGAPDMPVSFGGGDYWATIEDNGDDTFKVTSVGNAQSRAHAVEAIVQAPEGGIYDNAIFAGNSSGDPTYNLGLGGTKSQADLVDGDIYSGNDVGLTGDADVTGIIRAVHSISGSDGETGKSQPIPDLAGMDYAKTANFDVAALFAKSSTYKSNPAGGSAWQLPESSPAHIFRMNPSDRSTETASTKKNDYFLEDPYEAVQVDKAMDGSNPYPVTLSGLSGEPGVSSDQKVFYINGNLWLHNKKTYSLGLSQKAGDGVQITFVVSGNIYFSDNFFYENPEQDGVAFIAMTDPKVKDSGNVYFGDPVYGTLKQMNAFMYAENDFYDLNLSASGSAVVTLNGNMTAGDQVMIKHDFGTSHTKLTVNFDDRISTGELELPGLPSSSGVDEEPYLVIAWHRIALPAAAMP
jgi:glycine cleavage system H lipoate-binding protein/type II secretory pathway pseudopilin PulG